MRKRPVKAPRLHFVDTGLSCYLLGLRSPGQLQDHPLRGPLFESWVVGEAMKAQAALGERGRLFHWLDSRGSEADLIIDVGGRIYRDRDQERPYLSGRVDAGRARGAAQRARSSSSRRFALTSSRAGHRPVVLDNLCNSKAGVIERLAPIIGRPVDLVQGDIRDSALMRKVLRDHGVTGVIHLAGLKAVGESARMPLAYYDNNVVGSLRLLEAVDDCAVRSIVFSSSATVYGEPQRLPPTESHPLGATSPYGHTELTIELMLRDLAHSDDRWHVCLPRNFNPVGAHESGLIGEDPNGIPNKLMPFVLKVAAGQFKELSVWVSDYATPDGTGVRDYIHVVDLAEGHVRAMEHLADMRCEAINLGTGQGSSVLEVVKAFERVNGVRVPHVLKDRRPGDVAACWADPSVVPRCLG